MTKSKGKGRKSTMPRASVSLPADIYSTLEQIAHEKKVSLAWVLRDAAEKYIADKWPLFRGQTFGSADGQRSE
jgi:metal-responsive CopG/Arc/MetJ family transcriptional regulator